MTHTALAVALAVAVSSCGGAGSTTTTPVDAEPSAAAGETLFTSTVLASRPGCITCHSLSPDVDLVGPSLAGIGTIAADRIPGSAAEDYLQQSILDPDDFIVDEFAAGTMTSWDGVLQPAEVESLVAYLMTLR